MHSNEDKAYPLSPVSLEPLSSQTKEYSQSTITFDGERAVVYMKGSCEEIRHLCKAMCCRFFKSIGLTKAEYQTKLFEAEAYCLKTEKSCEVASCINIKYRLRRKKDGGCYHLAKENICSVYENRPRVCKGFDSCEKGRSWKITTIEQDKEEKSTKDKERQNIKEKEKATLQENVYAVSKKPFIDSLTEKTVFIINSTGEIKTLFYVAEKKRITCIVNLFESCEPIMEKFPFDHPELNDDHLLFIVKKINKRNTINDISVEFNDYFSIPLSKKGLYDFLWALYSFRLILLGCNAKNHF